MDSSCGLVERLQDLVLNLAWEQLLYLVCYHRNIDQLNQQLEDLELERRSIQHRIDEATNNAEEIEDKVQHWMQSVDEISEKVRKFHEEVSQAKIECSLTSWPNLWLRYKIGKRAKEMAQEVSKIYGTRNFDKVSYRKPPQWIPKFASKESIEGLDSRMLIIDQIMEALQNPSVCMIGLCGLGGVGKTTIAKEVEKKVENERMFEKVIMATVSDHVNIEDIQYQIAEKLGMELNEKTIDAKASHLCKRLNQERNMLLILDDLWKELDLGRVGIPLIGENNTKKNEGCKVLLTSRNETLLSNLMKCQKIIKVGVLLDNEAWELFKSIAEFSMESSCPDLISLAKEIVQKFDGLPLGIVTAAKALRNVKDMNVWKDALLRIKNPLRRNITGIKEVDPILRLSYDHLTEEYKHIFLLSAMLSHDPLIEDLVMYTVGLDCLKYIEKMEDAWVGVSTVVGKLKSLNLFLDSFSSDRFTIHDVIRDVALSIASKELHAFIVRHGSLQEWPDQNLLEGCKGICLEKSTISDIPEQLFAPRLEFFVLNSQNHDLAIPDTFFKSTKELKLLSLAKVCVTSLSSLSSLNKLRTLCLHSCLLKNITQVGSLNKLTILSLAYSGIEQLPIELAALTSLRMLNLAHCSELKVIPPKLLSSWKKLEVLHMENSFGQWKAEGSDEGNENASLDELKDLSISSLDISIPNASILPENMFLDMNLKRYRIFIGEVWRWYGSYETSKTLKLELKGNIHVKPGVRKLLEGVEGLYLHGSNGLESVLYNRFPHLRHLQIESNDDIEYIVLSSIHHEVALPILETLKLEKMNGLKKLCEGPIAPTFGNLKVIEVSCCQHLKWIFSASMVRLFSQLVEIKLKECNSVIEIVTSAIEDSLDQQRLAADEVIVFDKLHTLKMKSLPALANFFIKERATNNDCNKILKSLFSSKVFFPKLELLELSNLNNLISFIWDDRLPNNSFSKLRKLLVWQCGFVKLIPFQLLKSFNNLEELEVSDCDELEMVFDLQDLNSYKETPQSSSVDVPLKKLELKRLPKLKNVWSNNHNKGNVSFQSLRQVEVSDCGSLTSVFPASIAKGMLQHLEQLKIRKCNIEVIVAKDQVAESVAPAFVFSRLTSLHLASLPNLRNFYPQREKLEWPHVQRLHIGNCDELEVFEKEASKYLRKGAH